MQPGVTKRLEIFNSDELLRWYREEKTLLKILKNLPYLLCVSKFLCERPKTSVTISSQTFFSWCKLSQKLSPPPLLLVYFKEKMFVVFATLRSTSKWLDNHCNLAFVWGWHLGTKIFPGDENVWLGFRYSNFFCFPNIPLMHSFHTHMSY